MKHPASPSFIIGAVRAVICLAFAVSVQALAAQTVILIQDTFTLTGSTRVEGGRLAGTAPEQQTGSGVWKTGAGTSERFSANGTIINYQSGSTLLPVEMRIAIARPTAVTTVSASIVNSTSDWLAVGFLSSDTSSAQAWFGSGDSVLWVMLRPSGSWQVFKNGTSTSLASGTFSGFSSTASYTLGLSYDPVTQMARAFLSDGSTETSLYSSNGGWFATGLDAGTSITATGFRIHPRNDGTSVAGASSVDNFLVTTTAIPEPKSAALTLGGLVLFGLAACRWMRRGAV